MGESGREDLGPPGQGDGRKQDLWRAERTQISHLVPSEGGWQPGIRADHVQCRGCPPGTSVYSLECYDAIQAPLNLYHLQMKYGREKS